MDAREKLERLFAMFPGIGPRQAKRFVYFLLTRNNGFISELSSALSEIKKNISQCNSCYRFFQSDANVACQTCRSSNTDQATILIVEKDVDFENVHKSGFYNGRFFILGGLLPILEEEPAKKIRARELVAEVERQAKLGTLKEVIVALSLNPEGENTYQYIKGTLSPIITKYSLSLSTLGRGLSTGSEVEYSDGETLKYAIENRK
jgi:recombination protein RecR